MEKTGWGSLVFFFKPRLKMWSDSRFRNYGSICLKWLLFEILSPIDINHTRINQILLGKKYKSLITGHHLNHVVKNPVKKSGFFVFINLEKDYRLHGYLP